MDTPLYSRVLRDVVAEITGNPDPDMRPGQVKLMQSIASTMRGGPSTVGRAPTGTGKSIAYLTPAACAAVELGQRTVVTTESLALQDQIVNKDFPMVAAAVQRETGHLPEIAVLKGYSNYVCIRAARSAAMKTLKVDDPSQIDVVALRRKRKSVLAWALSRNYDTDTGDKAEFDGKSDNLDRDWEKVSTTSDACPSTCPLASQCFVKKARAQVADADVVVTNHAMVAMGAAKQIPVVISSKGLGSISHVIVDEAHALPGIVRNQGAIDISSTRIDNALNAVARVFGSRNDEGLDRLNVTNPSWVRESKSLSHRINVEISQSARTAGGDGSALPDNDIAITTSLGADIFTWIEEGKAITSTGLGLPAQEMDAIKATGRLTSFAADLSILVTGAGERMARWYELPNNTDLSVKNPTVRMSPVDVAPLLRTSTYREKVWLKDGQEPPEDGFLDDVSGDYYRALTTSFVSATLPETFPREIGVDTTVLEVESPFASAYSSSLLYVPRHSDDRRPVGEPPVRGRSLDTDAHIAWAGTLITELTEANGGSALILAATARAGREYARLLRTQLDDITVYSTWDNLTRSAVVDMWKNDPSSVLVGTRGLFTGVDAPGHTNSLVIIDRIPRSPGNPVDDARVRVLTDRGVNEFTARDEIYAGDASILLEQGVGRLIRSENDTGVVAILDPRLIFSSPIAYRKGSRARTFYAHAINAFTSRTTQWDEVVDRLGNGLAQAA